MPRQLNPDDPNDRAAIARNATSLALSATALAFLLAAAAAALHPSIVVKVIASAGALVSAGAFLHFLRLHRFIRTNPEQASEIRFPKVEESARQPPRRQAVRAGLIASFFACVSALILAGVGHTSPAERYLAGSASVLLAVLLGLYAVSLWRHDGSSRR